MVACDRARVKQEGGEQVSGKEGPKGERVAAKREGLSSVLRTVKELLVELGAAGVVA